MEALRSFPEDKLHEKVAGREYDFYIMLHGIIQHDIYHSGQIMVIKKSIPTPNASKGKNFFIDLFGNSTNLLYVCDIIVGKAFRSTDL